MQSTEEFLSLVLPTHGTRVLVEFNSTTLRNHTYVEGTPAAEIAADALELNAKGSTVYMALGGYEPETVARFKGRTAANTRWFRSLWFDIDVGPNKEYPTLREAAHAIESFVNDVGAPAPTIVMSGNGLHVYWPLEADVDVDTWRAASSALKRLADERGLRIDTTCTQDAARILRPVGTHNYKTTPPKEVRLIQSAGAVPFTEVQKHLTMLPVPAPAASLPAKINGNHAGFGLTAIDEAQPSDFSAKQIVQGCQQFLWAYQNQPEVKEPLWRAMIGTLYRTDNPNAIHVFSSKHPGYTFAETESKARAWAGGGVTCATLESLRPGGCTGCPKYGVIKSPSWFGVKSSTAAPPPPKIDESTGMPENWLMRGTTLCMRSDDGPQLLYNGVIEFGQPFKERDTFSKNEVQYLPVIARSPRDRHELYLHMGAHASMTDLKKAFSTVGILPEARMEKEFFNGMRAWIQKITNDATSVKPVRQLGWQSHEAGDTSAGFVIGSTLYLPGKQIPVRVDTTAERQARHMQPRGSLAEWKKAINVYTRPEYSRYALMSWLMFGAPLARLFGLGMPIAHFNSQGSGHGKSGVQDLLLSGAGDPREPNGRWTGNATLLSVYAYITAMNGNIAVLDETSAIPPEVLSKLMFEATMGSGRKAMQGTTGHTRDLPPISGILCTSGNMSLQQMAQTLKGNSDAQVARVFEFDVKQPRIPDAQRYLDAQTFRLVYENYGHAMPIYIEYVVNNQELVQKQLRKVEHQLIEHLGMRHDERFWRALLTVCITGALIAKKLGLIDHDVNALLPAALEHFMYQRATLQAEQSQANTLLQFLQDNQAAILVVDTDNPVTTASGLKLVTCLRTPPGHVNVRARYVTDTKTLYVDRRFLRAYCTEKNIDFRDLITDAKMKAWLVADGVRKDLTAYTRITIPMRTTVIVFNMDIPELTGDV